MASTIPQTDGLLRLPALEAIPGGYIREVRAGL